MTREDRIIQAVGCFVVGILLGPIVGMIVGMSLGLHPWYMPFTLIVPIGAAIWGYRNAASIEAFLKRETGE